MSAAVWAVIVAAAVDLAGRVGTLWYQSGHGGVRTLTYRTWVLLNAFVNFAWVAYWLCAREKNSRGED